MDQSRVWPLFFLLLTVIFTTLHCCFAQCFDDLNANNSKIVNDKSSSSSPSLYIENEDVKPKTSWFQLDGFERKTSSWPSLDPTFDSNSIHPSQRDFYFNDEEYSTKPKWVSLKIKPALLASNYMEENRNSSKLLTITFKVWIFTKENINETGPIWLSFGSNENDKFDLLQRYHPNYDGYWMPVMVRLNSDRLEFFRIFYQAGSYFLAFKDFKIKYEKLAMQVSKPEIVKSNIPLLCVPEPNEFFNLTGLIYFPVCDQNTQCQIRIKNSIVDSKNKFKIRFQAWFRNPTYLLINGVKSLRGIVLQNELNLTLSKPDPLGCLSLAFRVNSIVSTENNVTLCEDPQKCVELLSIIGSFPAITKVYYSNTSKSESYHYLRPSNHHNRLLILEPLLPSVSIDKHCLRLEFFKFESNQVYDFDVFYKIQSNRKVVFTSGSVFMNHEKMEFCFADYLQFHSTNFSVGIQLRTRLVELNGPAKVKPIFLIFKHSFVPVDHDDDNKIEPKFLHFTSNDWNLNEVQNREKLFTFDLDSKSIVFSDECDRQLNLSKTIDLREARFSTVWLNGSDGVTKKWVYSISRLFQEVQISLRLCDQLGQCHYVPQQRISGFLGDATQDYFWFEFKPLPLYRLEFVFQYNLMCDSFNFQELKISFKPVYFGHPCHKPDFALNKLLPSIDCQHGGQCHVDSNGKPKCNCPEQYLGRTCQVDNFCAQKNGYETCAKHNGLECINLVDGFKCACANKFNEFIWDSTTSRCVSKFGHFLAGFNDYPISLDVKNQSAGELLVSYHFDANDLTTGYDLCAHLNVSSRSKDAQIQIKFESLNNEPNSVSLVLASFNLGTEEFFEFCLYRDYFGQLYWQSQRNIGPWWKTFQLNFYLTEISTQALVVNSVMFKLENVKNWNYTSKIDYDKYFDENIKFNNWYPANQNLGRGFLFQQGSINNLIQVSSDWFFYPAFSDSFDLLFKIDSECAVEKVTSHLIYNNWYEQLFEEVLDSKKITAEKETRFRFSGLEPKTERLGIFKLVFKLYTSCQTVQLQHLDFENLCSGNRCGEHGHCKMDWSTKNARCLCDSGYIGDTCQWKNPCSEETIRKICDSSLSDHRSSSQCQFKVNSTRSYTCRCLTSQFEWSPETLSCEMKSYFETTQMTYDPEKNPFLDVDDFLWMNKPDAYYQLSSNFDSTENVFFSLPTGSNSKLTFVYSWVQPQHDLCLKMKVWRSSPVISFDVWINDDQPLLLDFDTNETRLCLNSLDDIGVLERKFHLDANIDKPSELIAISFSNIEVVNDPHHQHRYVPNSKHFTLINDLRMAKTELLNTFWPLITPAEAWVVRPDSNFFVYKSSSEKRNAYLLSATISNLIGPFNVGPSFHRFRFQYKLPVNISLRNFTITPVIFNSKMAELSWKTHELKKISNSQFYTYTGNFKVDSLITTKLRVGFKIEDSGDAKSSFNVSFFNLDLDDFCTTDNFTEENCGHGRCVVHFTKHRGYHCQCQVGFLGDNCESKDLCHYRESKTSLTGDDVCRENQGGRCVNQRNHFTCDCDNIKFWDNTDKKCKQFPDILTNSCNATHRVFDSTKAKCVCNEKAGFVENKQAKCVKYDPCTELKCHADSQCWSGFLGIESNEEKVVKPSCVCKDGFTLTSEGSCKASFVCRSPFRNPCQQLCSEQPNEPTCRCTDGYELTKNGKCHWNHDNSSHWKQCETIPNSYFDLKSHKCLCRTGFTMTTNYLNHGIDVCVPNGKLDQLTDCPCHLGYIDTDKKSNSFGQVRCQCFNSKVELPFEQEQSGTCHLGSICTECDNQNAMCFLDAPEVSARTEITPKPARCLCPPGQHLVLVNGSPICLDHCQDSWLVEKCSKFGATCNPLASIGGQFNYSVQHDLSDLCRCQSGRVPEYDYEGKLKSCNIEQNVFGLNLKLNVTSYLLTQTYQDSLNYDQILLDFLRIEHLNLNPIQWLLSQYSDKLSSTNMNQLLMEYDRSMKVNRDLIAHKIDSMQVAYAQREFNRFIQNWKIEAERNQGLNRISWIQFDSCQTVDSGNYYDCWLWFQLESKNMKDVQKWTSALVDSCHMFPNQNCFINLRNSSQFLILNKHQIDKIKTVKMKPCQQLQVCHRYPGTVCHDNDDLPTCDCAKCVDPDIIISGLRSKDSGFEVSNCTVNSTHVCKYCPSDEHYSNGTCSVVSFQETTIDIKCNCNSKSVSKSSKQLLLNGTFDNPISVYQTNLCIDPCANKQCSSHGHCMWDEQLKPFCSCYGDWEGELCDVKHSSRSSEVTKIIILIISIVGSIIIVLMLCLFIIWIKSNLSCRMKARVDTNRRFSFEMSTNGTYRKKFYEETSNTKKKEVNKPDISAPVLVNTSYSINMTQTRLEQERQQEQKEEQERRNRPSTSRQLTRVKVLPEPSPRARLSSTDFSDTSSNISLPPSRPPSPVPMCRNQNSSSSSGSTMVVLTRANLKKRTHN